MHSGANYFHFSVGIKLLTQDIMDPPFTITQFGFIYNENIIKRIGVPVRVIFYLYSIGITFVFSWKNSIMHFFLRLQPI